MPDVTEPAALERGLSPLDPSVRLSIIIVNWNTQDLLRACLESLHSYVKNPAAEVIVVDNHSTDGSAGMVTKTFPAVRLLALDKNLGFSGGNNVGLCQAIGQYQLLLNSDTEVNSDGLWKMCDYMDAHPQMGAVGARLLNPDGSIQPSCRCFPSYETAFFHRKSLLTRFFPGNRFSRKYLMTACDYETPVEVDWVMGACLMTKRSVLEQVGLLDDNYFMYAEDVDWCYRMRQAGWTIGYFPDTVVLHHYEKSASQMPLRMNKERHKSMWRFYRKHYSRGNFIKDVITGTGILARFLILSLTNYIRHFYMNRSIK